MPKNTGLDSLNLGTTSPKTAPKRTKKTMQKPKASSVANTKKVQRAIYFPAEVDAQLQELVYAEKKQGKRGASITGLILEAVDLLFTERDLPTSDHLIKKQ